MIKNTKEWYDFENGLLKNVKADYQENIRVFDELCRIAYTLKVYPLKNPLDGIETKIRISKILNKL